MDYVLPHFLTRFADVTLSRSRKAVVSGAVFLGCVIIATSVHAQEAENPPKDGFDREVEFINFLLDNNLFEYANLAVEELREEYAEQEGRIQVAEAGVLLRQGKTEPVEKILENRNLETDAKAQAILLRLAMTYDAMGNREQALTRYQQFLDLNEGKEITDPDVLRYFASAGMRLASILREQGKYDDAAKTLELVIQGADSQVLKRKFTVMAVQNRIDQAMDASGSTRKEALENAEEMAVDILYGANDNYWFMAMAQRAWITHLRGNAKEALDSLAQIREKAIEMENRMEDTEAPKSEYPRAVTRYVKGVIHWELAKDAVSAGNEGEAKKNAARAAGNFYNAFLKYEGNEYADRAALKFEELKAWVKETFGTELKMGNVDTRLAEIMFKRQLDLAKQLLDSGDLQRAETRILDGLKKYPDTDYSLGAFDTLSRIWIEQGDREWALMSLATYIAELYDDEDMGARVLLNIGRHLAEQNNLFAVETVLGAFGRRFPSHPMAPAMLYRIGKAADDRGDPGRAMEFYGQILDLYPKSKYAVTVLRLRGDEALKSKNYAEAIKAYERVRDQADPGLQTAYARLKIVDAKFASDNPELVSEVVSDLTTLREDLQPRQGSPYYQGDNAEKAEELLQNVRYRIGQVLLRRAGEQDSEELRASAAEELRTFLEDYPNSERAPQAMYNLGRLYLQQGRFDRATETFEQLARDYADSDEGRDALYSLVKAALEEGRVEVAREAVEKMVARPESYEIGKIYRVGGLMLENERWEAAADSFDLVLKSDRAEDGIRQRALYGKSKAELGSGDTEAAIQALEGLIKEFPTSSLVVDAGVTLAEAYIAKDPPEVEKAKTALGAVARILKSRPDRTGKALLDLTVGKIAMAEGNDNAALSSWYKVGITKPDSEELGRIVRDAIQLALGVAVEQAEAGQTGRWSLVVDLTDQYIKNFPMDEEAARMRSLNVKAIGLAPQED